MAPWKMHFDIGTRGFGQSPNRFRSRPQPQPDHPTTLHALLANRARPEPVQVDTTPIEDRLRNLRPLEFELVRRTGKEPLWNSLLEEHHYLGYEQPVGEHLKYLVWAQE